MLEGQSWDKKWRGSFVKWNLWIQPLKTLHHWNSNFCWALLKIFQYEKFEIQYQKYLTTEKYFEYLRRCKIEELWPSFCMSDATKATSKSLEKKILPEIIRFMCFWDINKNAKCKNAFVRSADPGIYSSIVSDVNFFRLMKNLRVKFSCCLWRNGHTMSSMTKSLKRVSWNYFNMSKQLGSIDWSKSKICYYLTPKWNHLVRKRSYLKYEFGANTLLSDAKTKQIWYLKIEKNWCGYVFISQ